MSERQRTRAVLLAAVGWLVAVTVVELSTGRQPTLVVSALYAIAPLIACAAVSTRTTAWVALSATVLATWSGVWTQSLGSQQQLVRLSDVILSGVVAIAIAELRGRREQRFARVARIAEVAQRAVLPVIPARVGPVRAAARYVAAGQDALVGGDLFDCFNTPGRTYFVVGDVRGKGVGAVEQAARVIRAFRQAAAVGRDLASVAGEMSRYLVPFLGEEDFATAVLVEVTAQDLTLVSCGHPAPLLITDGQGTLLQTPPGLPLGLGDRYETSTVPWREGQRLLLYTDGLSEARDRRGVFLAIAPLASRLAGQPVDDALEGLLSAVGDYTEGQAKDDLAVLLLENAGRPAPKPEPGRHFLLSG